MKSISPEYSCESSAPTEILSSDTELSTEVSVWKIPRKNLKCLETQKKVVEIDIATESSESESQEEEKEEEGNILPKLVKLHNEVNNFWESMSASDNEKDLRIRVVKHITNIIHINWPNAKVKVFGSFDTGLLLPTSDIDLVVFGEWKYLPLYTLKQALSRNGINENDIIVIPLATVPIVRFNHPLTGTKVDICFNENNCLKGAEIIKSYVKLYPALPKLVLVLKQFLICRNFNEVYYGGMSSYCLTILVVYYLQRHHKPTNCCSNSNLGALLVEFFELYGLHFNHKNVAVSLSSSSSYSRESSFTHSILVVDDPVNKDLNVSQGTFMYAEIRESFRYAYCVLVRALRENKDQRSMLSLILNVSVEVEEQRQRNKDNYALLCETFNLLCQSSERSIRRASLTRKKGNTARKRAMEREVILEKTMMSDSIARMPDQLPSIKRLVLWLKEQNISTLKQLKKRLKNCGINISRKQMKGLYGATKKNMQYKMACLLKNILNNKKCENKW